MTTNTMRPNDSTTWLTWPLGAVVIVAMFVIFDDGLRRMVLNQWPMPEFQHSYLIPIVSVYLVWSRAIALRDKPPSASWVGVVITALGLLAFLLGELSTIFGLVQYAFLLTLLGLIITVIGVRAATVLWAGLVYLVFMIPLPPLIVGELSGVFQLWSSQLGTAFLRLVGVSVYLEGNVIDLGSYRLQVVEACNGLRYLFPLTSFAFFCAYIFRGLLWQRVVLFVSAVPITILMNSFRIGVTGLLVNRFGTSQAEGFLHYFEGWVIFVACIALLFLEMWFFAKLAGRGLAEAFEVEIPELGDFRYLRPASGLGAPVIAGVALVVAGAVGSMAIAAREERVPEAASLKSFPLVIDKWSGRESYLADDVLQILKPTDYLIATYTTTDDPRPVELYVAYYESQRKDSTVHSPRACLPGGGWKIVDISQQEVSGALADGGALPLNRVMIEKDEQKALVYYWFMQRGRYLTNEYLVKWYIFWDALTRNRTDGAMVRVLMPVADGFGAESADARLAEFIRAVEPKLYYHIPQEEAVALEQSPR